MLAVVDSDVLAFLQDQTLLLLLPPRKQSGARSVLKYLAHALVRLR